MRAAVYARFSSDNQRDASIEDQFRVCGDHATKAGFEITERYSDYAVSGASLNRPGIQSLLQDCRSDRCDVVLLSLIHI